jgi:hypothetical protein
MAAARERSAGERDSANTVVPPSERAGRAAAIYYSLVESCKANKVNPVTYLTYVLSHIRDKRVTLLTPDEFACSNLTQIG